MTAFPNFDSYKGFIFDLDGTLINSMPLHVIAWKTVCQEHGFTIDPKLIYDMGGVSSRDVVVHLNKMGHETGDIDAFVKRKVELYREHIDEVKTFPSIEAILRQAFARGAKIAVGTGTQRINAEDIINKLNLKSVVSAIVSCNDVTKHKPFPDTFLKAAELLNLAPSECVVFEDGPLGVKAALAGGFDCVEVENGQFKHFHSSK